MNNKGIVIIGGGEAGARAAIELRSQGWTGKITIIGSEKHLPYERPPLSKQHLTEESEPNPVNILDETLLKEHTIQFLVGQTVTRLDREQHLIELSDRSKLQYEKLLLATGARSRKLALPGSGVQGVLYLRTLNDSVKIRQQLLPGKHVAIIGGGFIGLEVAASARKKGCRVTLVEAAPRILMRGVPEEIADMVEDLHRSNGVHFIIGTSIHEINEADEAFTIVLADGHSITCDTVIAGIGAIPETSLAEESGLEVENGIRVNQFLMTSDPDIYAAGDCCSFPHPLYGGRRIRLEAWRNAQEQGIHAAQNMLNTPTAYTALPWFWSDQFEKTLQVAGLAEGTTKKIVRDFGVEGRIYFHLSSDGILEAVSGMGTYKGIAKEMKFAEKLIERKIKLEREFLENPANRLKTLLKA